MNVNITSMCSKNPGNHYKQKTDKYEKATDGSESLIMI